MCKIGWGGGGGGYGGENLICKMLATKLAQRYLNEGITCQGGKAVNSHVRGHVCGEKGAREGVENLRERLSKEALLLLSLSSQSSHAIASSTLACLGSGARIDGMPGLPLWFSGGKFTCRYTLWLCRFSFTAYLAKVSHMYCIKTDRREKLKIRWLVIKVTLHLLWLD